MLYQTPSVVKLEYESLRLKSQGSLPPDCTGDCPNQTSLGFTCEDITENFPLVNVSFFVPGGSCNGEQSAECQVLVNGEAIDCDVDLGSDCNLETCGSDQGALVLCNSDVGQIIDIDQCGDINSVTVLCSGGLSDDCAEEVLPE